MMNIANLVAINVDTLRIGSRSSLEKEFNELIHINPCIVLYLNINQVDSYHGHERGPLT